MLLWFFMAVAATSLLPAVYFIKNSTLLFNSGYAGLNIGLDLLVFLGVPVLLSILSLCWMKHQAKDSMSDIDEISPVNNDYLPVYLGYIFVSLGIPAGASGGVDWVNLVVVYCMVCLFVAFSKSLCFNPVFILFGYGYYRVKTSNNVKVFVITKRKIRNYLNGNFEAELKRVLDILTGHVPNPQQSYFVYNRTATMMYYDYADPYSWMNHYGSRIFADLGHPETMTMDEMYYYTDSYAGLGTSLLGREELIIDWNFSGILHSPVQGYYNTYHIPSINIGKLFISNPDNPGDQ